MLPPDRSGPRPAVRPGASACRFCSQVLNARADPAVVEDALGGDGRDVRPLLATCELLGCMRPVALRSLGRGDPGAVLAALKADGQRGDEHGDTGEARRPGLGSWAYPRIGALWYSTATRPERSKNGGPGRLLDARKVAPADRPYRAATWRAAKPGTVGQARLDRGERPLHKFGLRASAGWPWERIMLVMTHETTTSKVLLVADSRAAAQGGVAVPIRRFRIARVRPENRPITTGSRVERAPPSS